MEDDTLEVGNSSASGDNPSSGETSQQSGNLATLQQRLDALEALYKGVQKGTDKINARVEQRVEEVLSGNKIGRIAELAKAGKSSAEIENQLLLDELLAERKGRAFGSQPAGAGKRSGEAEEQNIYTKFVDEFGLDANDKQVAKALSENDLVALARVAVSKGSAPAPDASTQPPITGKEKPGNIAEEIERGYLEEIKKVPRGNTHQVALVKNKWRQKAREAGLLLNV